MLSKKDQHDKDLSDRLWYSWRRRNTQGLLNSEVFLCFSMLSSSQAGKGFISVHYYLTKGKEQHDLANAKRDIVKPVTNCSYPWVLSCTGSHGMYPLGQLPGKWDCIKISKSFQWMTAFPLLTFCLCRVKMFFGLSSKCRPAFVQHGLVVQGRALAQ